MSGNGYLEARVRVGDYLAARAQQMAGGNIGDEIGTLAVTDPDEGVVMRTLLYSDLVILLRHGSFREETAPLAEGLREAAAGVGLIPLAALLQGLADWIQSASMVDLIECGWLAEASAVVRALRPERTERAPGSVYRPGDPRGFVEYQDCTSDLCAAQRHHTARCRAAQYGGAQ